MHSSTEPIRANGDASIMFFDTPNIDEMPSTVAARSFVTFTKNVRMFISMSLIRCAPAAATIATFSSTDSAVMVESASGPTTPAVNVPLIPMMSASRAAYDNTRFPPPPIRSGGRACTGFGWPL